MYSTLSLLDKIKKYTNITENPPLLAMLEDALDKLERYEFIVSDCDVEFDTPEELQEYLNNAVSENESWVRAANFTGD